MAWTVKTDAPGNPESPQGMRLKHGPPETPVFAAPVCWTRRACRGPQQHDLPLQVSHLQYAAWSSAANAGAIESDKPSARAWFVTPNSIHTATSKAPGREILFDALIEAKSMRMRPADQTERNRRSVSVHGGQVGARSQSLARHGARPFDDHFCRICTRWPFDRLGKRKRSR